VTFNTRREFGDFQNAVFVSVLNEYTFCLLGEERQQGRGPYALPPHAGP